MSTKKGLEHGGPVIVYGMDGYKGQSGQGNLYYSITVPFSVSISKRVATILCSVHVVFKF